MPPHAVCVTADPQLRRTLRRALGASGTTVEFVDHPQGIRGQRPDLIVLDPPARRAADLDLLSQAPAGGVAPEIVVVGESLRDDDVLALLGAHKLNHVVSNIGTLGELADEGLVVAIGKLAKGDIFGIEKYLAWGVHVRERLVQSYEQKRDLLLEVADYAQEVGARRQAVSKIESVADELLMNALYDAPALRYGVPMSPPDRSRGLAEPIGEEPATVRYASDGRWFAVSVRDNYGELRKEAILAALQRARAERGPQTRGNGGAGLGMYYVLTSVTRFVANIQPGQQTEVIALFDLQATAREPDPCAKSIHIFTTA
jgi:hypothetical protein